MKKGFIISILVLSTTSIALGSCLTVFIANKNRESSSTSLIFKKGEKGYISLKSQAEFESFLNSNLKSTNYFTFLDLSKIKLNSVSYAIEGTLDKDVSSNDIKNAKLSSVDNIQVSFTTQAYSSFFVEFYSSKNEIAENSLDKATLVCDTYVEGEILSASTNELYLKIVGVKDARNPLPITNHDSIENTIVSIFNNCLTIKRLEGQNNE